MKSIVPICFALTILSAVHGAIVSPPAHSSLSAAGNSFNPAFSAEGRHLVFVSHANNLVTNDDLGLWLDVFVHDLVTSNTVLVSVSSNGVGGANSDANYPSISSNGQFVAFSSRADNLVPGTSNGFTSILVRDLAAGQTLLASRDTNGNPVAANSTFPLISANGRYVFFESDGRHLRADASANDNGRNIYRRDLLSNVTELASANVRTNSVTFRRCFLESITPDGRFVGYTISTNNSLPVYAYVHDMQSGTSLSASINAEALLSSPNIRCSSVALSDDGRYAAFIATPDGGVPHALRHDLQFGNTIVISANVTNVSHGLQMSADGRYVLFEQMNGDYSVVLVWDSQSGTSTAVACTANDALGNPVANRDFTQVAFIGCSNVYVSAVGGSPVLVSANSNGTASRGPYAFVAPAISPDGALVVWAVDANDLVEGDRNGASDIFLRDLNAGQTRLITRAQPTLQNTTAMAHSFLGPNSVSADGGWIVSLRYDDPSAWRDTNGARDVFVSDVLPGTTHALTIDTNLYTPGQGGVFPGPGGLFYRSSTNAYLGPIISADGSTIAAVVGGQSFPQSEIHWARASNGVFGTGASIAHRTDNPNGSTFGNNGSYAPSFSSNGLAMAFTTASRDFFCTNIGVVEHFGRSVIVRRWSVDSNGLLTGANYLASINLSGTPSFGDSTNGVISPDARWVIFESTQTDLVTNATGGMLSLFARDLMLHRTHLVSVAPASTAPLAFAPGSARISASSRWVTFRCSSDPENRTLFVHDLWTGTTAAKHQEDIGLITALQPNSDASILAYEFRLHTANPLELRVRESNGTSQVVDTHVRAGSASISGDGRYVLYAKRFPNGGSAESHQILVRDRLLGQTMIVSANSLGSPGNYPSTHPVLAADGRTVVFQSFASDLVAGDFNDKRDIFVLKLGSVDSEPDGMDDDWEMAYFETLSRDGTLDFDNDGASDLAEFLAGTDPTNSNSVFRVLTLAPAGGGSPTLLWSGNPQRSYRAEYKDELNASGWTALSGNISWNGSTASIVDNTAADATNRFYRVLRLP